MFEYVNRTFKRLSQPAYENVADPKSIVHEEIQQFQTDLESLGVRIPEVHLSRSLLHCWHTSALNAEYLPDTHQLRVCVNLIKSSEDLRGVVARELTWLKETSQKKPSSDAETTRVVIHACKAEMSRVTELDAVSREEATRVCAQLYLKSKLLNRERRQVDAWHFYTRQLVHENMFTYCD